MEEVAGMVTMASQLLRLSLDWSRRYAGAAECRAPPAVLGPGPFGGWRSLAEPGKQPPFRAPHLHTPPCLPRNNLNFFLWNAKVSQLRPPLVNGSSECYFVICQTNDALSEAGRPFQLRGSSSPQRHNMVLAVPQTLHVARAEPPPAPTPSYHQCVPRTGTRDYIHHLPTSTSHNH